MPQRIGRYQLLLPIATGGMATVYLARQSGPAGFQRDVALKLVHPHLRESGEWITDLIEEAKLAARIRHPNVVPILDVGDEAAGVFLAMEYIEGDSLAGLLAAAGGKIPPDIGRRILCDGLAGLHAAHELKDDRGFALGVVHRDFSPQNLLVGIDGVCRLTDFGIAKAASRLTVTRTGTVKGKVAYMSPEQARGLPLDRRADVWSAGAVAWEVFAGRRLFEGDEEIATGLRVVTEKPPLLSTVDPSLPKPLAEAVASALIQDVDARCPTAEELRRRIAETGPLADPSAVAEYVADLAAPALEQRRMRVAELRVKARARRRAPLLIGAVALMATFTGWRALRPAPPPCGADLQTAADHCGACNHSCLGGACVGGQCQPILLAANQGSPYGIAVDEAHVYWTNLRAKTVVKIAKNGDPKTRLQVSGGEGDPRFLALDDTNVYWTEWGRGRVVTAAKSGGAQRVLVSDQAQPWEIAADATHVYFGSSTDGTVKRVTKDGTSLETIATGADAGAIAVDDENVYWTERQGGTAGTVRRWSKREPLGRFVVLATNQSRPSGIAVDREAIFWTTFNGGTINMLAKSAAPLSPPTELARGQYTALGIALDSDWIYFASRSGHTVSRVSRRGGQVVNLPVGHTRGPIRVVVDARALYWTGSESSGVFKLAK